MSTRVTVLVSRTVSVTVTVGPATRRVSVRYTVTVSTRADVGPSFEIGIRFVDVGFACTEGVCGSCRVPVLHGVPDHRDVFLTQDERDANDAVMVCCSGARTPSLTLDL